MANMIAEEMTGLREHPKGFGQMYADGGNPLDREQAQDWFLDGNSVEVPNAGAGSYEDVFEALGFVEVKPIEWSSSAGDWTFAVRDDDTWRVAYQSNRYPRHGFSYSLGSETFESYEDACDSCG
jgi:hypothetical protein